MIESKKVFWLICCFSILNTNYLISEVCERATFPGFNGKILVNGLPLKDYNKSMDKMVRDAICEAYNKIEQCINILDEEKDTKVLLGSGLNSKDCQ